MVTLADVRYVVDENLMGLGNGMVALRRDTARFSLAPVDALLPAGILDPDWIPIIGDAAGCSSPSTDGCVRGQLRRR